MHATSEQIKEAMVLPVCTGWDRGFLESVLSQIDKGRRLSARQNEILEQVLARNTTEDQQRHERWEGDYISHYQERAKIVAVYYARQPYYRDIAKDILNDVIPDHKQFIRMFENKYAKKVLEEFDRPAKYERGTYVMPRANFSSRSADFGDGAVLPWADSNNVVTKFDKNGGFIMEVCKEIYSSAKNSKRYKILPVGATIPFTVEERHIKIKRK